MVGGSKENMKRYQIFCDIDESTLTGLSGWIDTIQDGEKAMIEICSHGGLVFYGNAAYQKILYAQRRGIEFICMIWGVCASSASDIALSCNRIEMAKTAAIMIHSAWNDGGGSNDEGIDVANDAQLAVIRKRLPEYTRKDLKIDRWFRSDEALKIGLIDSIFDDNISISSKLAAKYIAAKKSEVLPMDEEKKEVIDEKIDEKIDENVDEKKDPTVEELIEELVERVAKLEGRIAALEKDEQKPAAECDDKSNAKRASIYARIQEICKPCTQKYTIEATTPKAELEAAKRRHPDGLEKYINER